MQIDKIAFFGDSYCADFEDTYIEQLSKDYEILHSGYFCLLRPSLTRKT